ncbi:unnamed protein product, partial [Vitis vinifera]
MKLQTIKWKPETGSPFEMLPHICLISFLTTILRWDALLIPEKILRVHSSLHFHQPVKIVHKVLDPIYLTFLVAIFTIVANTNVNISIIEICTSRAPSSCQLTEYWILNMFPARCGKGVSDAGISLIRPPYELNTIPGLPNSIIFFHSPSRSSLDMGFCT